MVHESSEKKQQDGAHVRQIVADADLREWRGTLAPAKPPVYDRANESRAPRAPPRPGKLYRQQQKLGEVVRRDAGSSSSPGR